MTSADAHDERDCLERDGWVVLPDVLSSSEVARLRSALAPVLEANGRGRNPFEGESTERVYALLGKCPEIAPLVEHPRVLALGDALLEPGYLLSSVQAVNIHPGETRQPLHADDDPGPLGRPRGRLGFSTMWALDDFTKTNGATRVVPGSHEKQESVPPDEDAAIPVEMTAGSVLVYLSGVEHGGGAHTAGPPRLGVSVVYCQPWLRQFENLMVAVPRERARSYSERVQRMLGYGLYGVWGSVDGRDPMRLLRERS